MGLFFFGAIHGGVYGLAQDAVRPRTLAWPGDTLKPKIFEAWKRRLDSAGGVHAWRREYANGQVFQEWTLLLDDARRADPSERKRIGLRLQDYVLRGSETGGPIRPWGRTGTTLPLPGTGEGDYDMAVVGCMTLIGLFANDSLLMPHAALTHLLGTVAGLFGQETQGGFDVGVLRFPETENHVFMTEGSRLLANEMLLRQAPRVPALAALRDSLRAAGVQLDNARGRVREGLLKLMAGIIRQGFFETNARIYQRFTVHALLNLQAFSEDAAIRDAATLTLDYLGALFALQSCEGVRWGPYRRSSETYDDSTLYVRDAVASFFAVHSGVFPWSEDPDRGLWRWQSAHAGMALWAVVLPYRPPAAITALLQGDKGWYHAEIASGQMRASRTGLPTESYAGGPRFVLAAGGPHEGYGGANFPTGGRTWDQAPWVYDVLNRPAALVLAPRDLKPRVLGDLLHLRGSLWRAPAAKLQGMGFEGEGRWQGSYGPWHVPASWPTLNPHDLAPSGAWPDAWANRAHWAWPQLGLQITLEWPQRPVHSRFSRDTLSTPGRIRVVPLGSSDTQGSAATAPQPSPTPERAFTLSDTLLPFAFPFWRGWEIDSLAPTRAVCRGPKGRRPHVHAFAWREDEAPEGGRTAAEKSFVCVDGQGHFYAYHAPSGAYTVANFSLWWRPLRRSFP